MSISTYAELQTSVGNWLHRSDLTGLIPDFIVLGEKRIYRDLRIRAMETALNTAVSNSVLAVPSDYLSMKSVYVDGTPTSPLSRVSASQIYQDYPNRSSTGKPVEIAREGANFIFGPAPDSSYTIKGIYYARPTSITTSANAVFTANPDLYLYAALCEAAPYIKDEKMILAWESKFGSIMQALTNEDADEYGSGGGLSVTAG